MEEKIKSEIDEINQKLLNPMNFKTDNFHMGLYCDVLDSSKNWCVGQILEKKENVVKVHFEGWSDKHDTVFYSNNN